MKEDGFLGTFVDEGLASQEIIRRTQHIARARGISMALVALAWLIQKEVYPIVGVNGVERIEELTALSSVKLSVKETQYLEEPYKRLPTVIV